MDLFETTYKEYLELCRQARDHNYLYFECHAPVIDDLAYDALLEKIKVVEKAHPEWVLSDSPTRRLGEKTTKGFQSMAHRRVMLSLDKAFTLEQLERFDKRIRQEVMDPVYCVEYKMDGLALSIWYEKGRFVRALTRGDGEYGDDVTANVRAMGQIPLELPGCEYPFLELRAEVYMTFEAFEKNNAKRQALNLEPMANPRNAAAGTMKLLDSSLVKERSLSIAIYSAQDDEDRIPNLEASWDLIHHYNLPCIEHHQFVRDMESARLFIESAEKKRATLAYGIDGVVIKLSDYVQAARLGATGQYYRWGIAYKFSPEKAITKLLDIQLQVGRTGVVTPVAHLQPVFLDGSLIARCTLHNSDEIARKDIRIGDVVEIAKGGDIIPKIICVHMAQRNLNSKPWTMPQVCPVCGAALEQAPGEVAWRCIDEYGCPAQRLGRIIYFAKQDGFDIDGLGERTVEQLVDRGMVKDAADLFLITSSELLQLEGFADLSAQKLVQAIQNRKKITLEKFLVALNIKHLGVHMAHSLSKAFGSLEAICHSSLDELMRVDAVGPKVAWSVYTALQPNHLVHQLMEKLLAAGVVVESQTAVMNSSHPFHGKVFVLTGSLHRYTRSQASRLIRERGGGVASQVSGKTDFLLAGEESGSKLEKALLLNITILNEETFEKMLPT